MLVFSKARPAEPEIRDLRGEVSGLKTFILAKRTKRTESESMKKTLRWTERKLLNLRFPLIIHAAPQLLLSPSPVRPPRGLHAAGPQGGVGTGGRTRGNLACKDRPNPTVPSSGILPLGDQAAPQLASLPSSRQPPRGLQASGPQGGEEAGGEPASATRTTRSRVREGA